MKVLIISDRPFYTDGYKSGATIAAMRVAQALSQSGCEVDVYSTKYYGNNSSFNGIKTNKRVFKDILLHIDLHTIWLMLYYFCISRINIRKRIVETIKLAEMGYLYDQCNNNYDVIHFHDFSILLYYLYKRLNNPKVITMHGLFHGMEQYECSDNKYLSYYHEMEKYEQNFYKFATYNDFVVTFVSSGMKRRVLDIINCNPLNFFVVGNIVDVNIKKTQPDFNLRSKLGIQMDNKILLCVGTISARKNQLQLVRAYNLLSDKDKSQITIIICGDKTIINIDEYISELNLSNRIKAVGFIAPDEMKSYYEISDGVIVSSVYETFGMPIIESLAMGKPVMFSKDLDIYEDIYDNNGCVCFNSLDDNDFAIAITKLAYNKWDSKKVKKIAESFEPGKIAAKYIDIYQNILNTNVKYAIS